MDGTNPPKRCVEVESSGAGESHRTFILHSESHTLGNALHYVLARNPEVTYSGYNKPHVTEDKINVRIQSQGTPPLELMKTALTDVKESCLHVHEKLQKSFSKFKEAQAENSS